MSVISAAKSAKARIVLAAGVNPETGRAVTKNVYLSGLAGSPDGEKIYNVVDAAAPVLVYPVSLVETTEVRTLEKTA